MSNLQKNSLHAGDLRPFQVNGYVDGYKNGSAVSKMVEWLVDTGASVSVVTKNVGDLFDLTPTGASANATTGGAGIMMNTGLSVEFTVRNPAGNDFVHQSATLDVGKKPDNSGSEVLGMDQVAAVGAGVVWDPKSGTGDVRQ